jgi:uncharacterized RDD family membrane protein YckC
MATEAVAQNYAGFWRRLGGLIIDAIIVGVIAGVITAILNAVGVSGTGPQAGVGFIVGLVYFIWGWGSGQTVGCMALNMRMVDLNTGSAPGYGKALIRYIVNAILGVTGILALISDLWMIWDSKKQTWQDKVAGTIVVNA